MTVRIAPCRVCGHQVADTAPACPGCGDPTARRYGLEPRRKAGPWTVIGWLILLPVILVVGSCLSLFSH